MIDNNQIERLVTALLEGKASVEEKEFLTEWVKVDPENYRYFRKLINIHQALNPAFNPKEIDMDSAEKKVLSHIRQKKSPTTILWTYWQRIAAVLIIPLLLLSVYLMTDKDQTQTGETEYQTIKVPYGMTSQLNLPDGSLVWLNGGSSLEYPVRFKEGERNVKLNGEGYFEIESDKKNPFIVKTATTTLVATGTSFNINAYDIDTITAITLVDGIVDVKFGNANPINMKPGEHANFNNKSLKCILTKTDPYKWYAWKDGMLIFRDDPLSYVFKRLQIIFNIDIKIKNPGITDALYRATFEGESLSEILRLLEMSAPIKFVYQTREKTTDNHYEKQQIEVYRRVK